MKPAKISRILSFFFLLFYLFPINAKAQEEEIDDMYFSENDRQKSDVIQ